MAWVTKDSQEQYNTQPQPPREYSKKEKAQNWWHYYKWVVVGGVVAVIALAWIIKDTVFQTRPDYQVAYVGQHELPADTAAALSTALQAYGQDRNGDGQVVVALNQYTLDFNSQTDGTDAYGQMAGVTKLSADLSGGKDGSYIFIVDDIEGFEAQTTALQYLDGTLPEIATEDDAVPDLDWENMVYRWSDCPVLAGLDLGDYQGYTMMDDATGSSQELLANLYVGRRGCWTGDIQAYADDAALWDALTAGAVKLPEATR